jgi:hypothetical protein
MTNPVARPGHIAILENGRELFLRFASDRTAAGTFALILLINTFVPSGAQS